MKIEEAANYLKEELARWERDCKSNHPMKDALALAIQMLETGEVYMTGDDYNLFIKGYKDGMKDYKSLVEESDPADSENKVRLINANALKAEMTKCQIADFIAVQSVLDTIDNAPTVKTFTLLDIEENYKKGLEKGLSEWETERPQGEWIKDEEHSITINMFKCSNCGGGGYPSFKYCSHCGALMVKEEKNESRS